MNCSHCKHLKEQHTKDLLGCKLCTCYGFTDTPNEAGLEAWISKWMPDGIDALTPDLDSRSAKERLRDILAKEIQLARREELEWVQTVMPVYSSSKDGADRAMRMFYEACEARIAELEK